MFFDTSTMVFKDANEGKSVDKSPLVITLGAITELHDDRHIPLMKDPILSQVLQLTGEPIMDAPLVFGRTNLLFTASAPYTHAVTLHDYAFDFPRQVVYRTYLVELFNVKAAAARNTIPPEAEVRRLLESLSE